jgi:hypothetical protein
MEWAESSGEDYIFGLGGNAVLDARVARPGCISFLRVKTR